MKRKLIIAAIFIFTLLSGMTVILADATNTTEGFAGSVQSSATGDQITLANITLNISTQASCTAGVIYTETFVDNVTYGVFSIHAGAFSEHLNLQYGSTYYYCYNINNGSLSETFGAYPFTSGKGMISSEDMNTTAHYEIGELTVIGNIFQGDNDRHYFGDSNDAYIQWDGSNLDINGSASGLRLGAMARLISAGNMELRIGGTGGSRTLTITDADGMTKLYIQDDGKVRFYNEMSYWGDSPYIFNMGRGADKDAYLCSSDNADKVCLFLESDVGFTFDHQLDMNTEKIVNVLNPTAAQDAATKDYVDAYLHGLEWQASVLDKDLTDPPAVNATGDRYIIAAVAGGNWTGSENNVTEWMGDHWEFFSPVEGWAIWVEDENLLYVFDGTNWVGFGGAVDHGNLLGLGDDDHTDYLTNARGDARYLYRENVGAFTPDGDYEPATKKYVDDNSVDGLGTDNRIVRWDGVHAVQNSGVTLSDSNDMSGVRNIAASGLIITAGDIGLHNFGGTGDFIARDGSVGWTGTFMDLNMQTVTVKNGIITNVA